MLPWYWLQSVVWHELRAQNKDLCIAQCSLEPASLQLHRVSQALAVCRSAVRNYWDSYLLAGPAQPRPAQTLGQQRRDKPVSGAAGRGMSGTGRAGSSNVFLSYFLSFRPDWPAGQHPPPPPPASSSQYTGTVGHLLKVTVSSLSLLLESLWIKSGKLATSIPSRA